MKLSEIILEKYEIMESFLFCIYIYILGFLIEQEFLLS